jgi:hypothetical protein
MVAMMVSWLVDKTVFVLAKLDEKLVEKLDDWKVVSWDLKKVHYSVEMKVV